MSAVAWTGPAQLHKAKNTRSFCCKQRGVLPVPHCVCPLCAFLQARACQEGWVGYRGREVGGGTREWWSMIQHQMSNEHAPAHPRCSIRLTLPVRAQMEGARGRESMIHTKRVSIHSPKLLIRPTALMCARADGGGACGGAAPHGQRGQPVHAQERRDHDLGHAGAGPLCCMALSAVCPLVLRGPFC